MTQNYSELISELRSAHRDANYAAVVEKCNELPEAPSDPEVKLLLGLSFLMSGEQEHAQPLLADAAEVASANALWASDLALLKLLQGNVDESESLLLPLVEANEGGLAVDYARFAAVQMTRGDLELAADYYQRAVFHEPGRDTWYSNLAGIQLRLERYEEALTNYRAALSFNADNGRAEEGQMNCLAALERTDELIAALQEKQQQSPDDSEVLVKLALVYDASERTSEALSLLRGALVEREQWEEVKQALDTDEERDQWVESQSRYLTVLAQIWIGHARYDSALRLYKRLSHLKGEDYMPAQLGMISCLIELDQLDDADEILSRIESLSEGEPPAGVRLHRATFYSESERYDEAQVILRELAAEQPGNPQILVQLAQNLMWLGQIDEAADYFQQAARINPAVLASMVNAGRMPEDPETIEHMVKMARNPLLPDGSRASMSFSLAKYYDKQKDFENAFEFLALANEIESKKLNYKPAQFSSRVGAIKSVFSKQYFKQLETVRPSERTPIFVVGMPRSGTTLTEQILCSHPRVFGAGELNLIPEMTRLMPQVLAVKRRFPGCMKSMTPHLREEAARFYLHGLDAYDADSEFVVDKLPHNFVNLGLIASVLPSAKIIHIRRDPRDIAMSNYQQNFKAKHGGMGYAFNLEHIAQQINDYHNLMEYWRDVLPVPMFELTYEELVGDQEGMTAELLNFVGVDWDDSVRDFHTTERAVRTASVSQVRQPIYKSSRQKWKHYEQWLAPLLDNLSPDVTAFYDQVAP